MGIACLLHISDNFGRQLPVVKIFSGIAFLKGTEIKLVNADRRIFLLLLLPFLHPFAVFPGIVKLTYNRCGIRPKLLAESIGVGFQVGQSPFGLDFVFIAFPGLNVRHKNFKNAAFRISAHLMHSSVPVVEIPNHTDTDCIRRPDGKMCPLYLP